MCRSMVLIQVLMPKVPLYWMLLFISISLLFFSHGGLAKTECVWATGRLLCEKNQSIVVGSVIELWDLDAGFWGKFFNRDDKAGVTIVDDPHGIFTIDGCATDLNWLWVKNHPEFYLSVFHHCNNETGEWLKVNSTFQIFVPTTYDHHMENPIKLDKP